MRRVLLAALLTTACEIVPRSDAGTGGGAGGGGGGAQMNTFSKGFVFVRRDDKQVYVSDQSDFNTVFAITAGASARTPSLSKDGSRVVFINVTSTDTEIATVPSRGGDITNVMLASSTGTARNLRNPVFTPDGSHIVFSFDNGSTPAVGIVDTTGAGYTIVSPNDGLAYTGASLYPDGTAVLASAGGSSVMLDSLRRIDLSTGMATIVLSTLGLDAVSFGSRVVVSPDGTKAAFDAHVSSGSVRTFVADLTSQAVTQLTDYPGDPGANDSAPCWQGSDKVCFSSDTGGNDAAYALPASAMRTSGGLELPAAVDPWFGPN
jgi:Tol biopolymer transport system component